MAMPFIFDRAKGESGPERARRNLGEFLRTAIDFAMFAAIALAVLIAIAAIRLTAFMH